MPVAGRRLDYGWSLALCYSEGFRLGHGLIRAVGVMNGESGRYLGAWHVNKDGSVDRGVFQINNEAHPDVSDEEAYSAIPATRFAFQLSQGGTDFHHWSAFKHKSPYYLVGLVAARWFYSHGTGWRKRVEKVAEELG